MVAKRLNLEINGEIYPVNIRYRLKDYSNSIVLKKLEIDDPKWLVQYDRHAVAAVLDASAPTWYIELAALHELICVGGYYHDLVEKIVNGGVVEGDRHCESVERFILEVSGKHRAEYIAARIEMLDLILQKGLNRPLEPQLMHTLAFLHDTQAAES